MFASIDWVTIHQKFGFVIVVAAVDRRAWWR